VPPGFKDEQDFIFWRKHIRSALSWYQAAPNSESYSSSWNAIMETVMENKGKGRMLGGNSHLSIAVLASWAFTEGCDTYLLRNLAITRPNQVWCVGITYIPMRRGAYIWWRLWIGTVAKICPGVCQTMRPCPPLVRGVASEGATGSSPLTTVE